MVANGDGHKEIALSSTAVAVLSDLNKKKRDEKFDFHFLTALLIGFCTIKKIKLIDAVEKGILDLVKDLFNWRVMNNESRMNGFDNLLSNVIKGIKTRNYKA